MKEIYEQKATLRRDAKVRRAQAFAAHGAEAGHALARHGLGFAGLAPKTIVSAFMAFRDEIDPAPLLLRLHNDGYGVALPVIVAKAKPLEFRSWVPGEPLLPKQWGILEPPESAGVVVPDVVLVPLLAFDARGYRVGYGGGFYDRSLAEIRAHKPVTAIGLAFDEQWVDAVPIDDYDQPLDWVLTPSGPIACQDH